jgi:hypothetical protein
MKNFYTGLEIKDSSYIGTVYSSNSNQVLYRTQEYDNQQAALNDISNYINNVLHTAQVNKEYKAPSSSTTTFPTSRKCCGR